MAPLFLALLLALPSPRPARLQAPSKTIQDPAEYNAYMKAIQTAAPAEKAALMEAFVLHYPGSVMKLDALEQAMAAYQQAGNIPKVEEVGRRLLVLDATHLRALAILAFLDRAKGTPAALQEAAGFAATGLRQVDHWRPSPLSEADASQQRRSMTLIFHGAAGQAALQAKEWIAARGHLAAALALDPLDLQNLYQAGIAELSMDPQDLTGFWHLAKALQVANRAGNGAGAAQIEAYAKSQFRRYHGSEEGWPAFRAQCEPQSAPPPPADLQRAIPRKPTPCELAVQAVKEYDVSALSLSDWEFVLERRDCSPANGEAAAKVWAGIQRTQKGGAVKLQWKNVQVVSATASVLEIALTEENQAAHRADLRVRLSTPLSAAPKAGAHLDVTGRLTGYEPSPFRFLMDQGEVAAAQP